VLVRTDLAILDQQRGISPLKLPYRAYEFPRVSPDGKRIAVGTNDGAQSNVWIYDLSGASAIRQLTFGGSNRFPVWSGDSERVTFQSNREGDFAIFWQRADGNGTAERLTKPDAGTQHVPDAWSSDGNHLLFEVATPAVRTLFTRSVRDGSTGPVGDIQHPLPLDAAFSPDGRWLAYRSTSAMVSAIWVQPFPPTGTKSLIANGIHPVWSRDGRRLIFRQLTSSEFMVTDVTMSPAFNFATPKPLARNFVERQSNGARRNHDLMPDGRIVGVVNAERADSTTQRIDMVLNWFEELRQRVPASR
jgi:Tol biopolymer transport system component